ncbi:hypothetical protein A2U01_0094759, partial [Trifolium medium]|nr:hypothetical protein [Trifolium medium]
MLDYHGKYSIEIREGIHDKNLGTNNNIMVIKTSEKNQNKIFLLELMSIAHGLTLASSKASAVRNWA